MNLEYSPGSLTNIFLLKIRKGSASSYTRQARPERGLSRDLSSLPWYLFLLQPFLLQWKVVTYGQGSSLHPLSRWGLCT